MENKLLIDGLLAGDRLSLARLITQVENATPAGLEALDSLFPFSGHAHLIGVTGPPGAGKSSLVNRLAYHIRHPIDGQAVRRVGIIAVDPTSPFTGGAILGDRIRMHNLAGDPGVFIRSMATHGALGGLAYQTGAVTSLMDAAGYDVIFIETVGAGQSEVDIARLAHTTLVVETPGMGDDIQALKAGILEIADIIVINKADQAGADITERILKAMLEQDHIISPAHHKQQEMVPGSNLKSVDDLWKPIVLKTVAIDDTGIPELIKAIQHHHQHIQSTDEWQHRQDMRLQAELTDLIQRALIKNWRDNLPPALYQQTLHELLSRQISPLTAADRLINR